MIIPYPITTNYLSHWGIVDALKEFVQNAIDASTESGYDPVINYFPEREVLAISNQGTLDKNSLLFGYTTKTDQSKFIGQFGEGYKIASLVLLREKCNVNITSSKSDTIIVPRILHNDMFDTPTLHFEFIEKKRKVISKTTKKKEQTDIVVVTISNITKSVYEDFRTKYIIPKLKKHIEINHSYILLDQPGYIYVSGLFVCHIKELKFGYSFKPGLITINRDRNIASNFDVCYESSKLWGTIPEEYKDILYTLISSDALDVTYIDSTIHTRLRKVITDSYKERFGEAIPISTTEQYNQHLAFGYSSLAYVSKTLSNVVQCSSSPIRDLTFTKNMNPRNALLLFQIKHERNINTEAKNDLAELIVNSSSWRLANKSTDDKDDVIIIKIPKTV